MTKERLEEMRWKYIKLQEAKGNDEQYKATAFPDEPFYDSVVKFIANLRKEYIKQLEEEFNAM